jgi:hypothetical protein
MIVELPNAALMQFADELNSFAASVLKAFEARDEVLASHDEAIRGMSGSRYDVPMAAR